MKLEDRIQALKRSSKYRKDYEIYDEYRHENGIIDSCILDKITPIFHISPKGKKLCDKYKIHFPFDPDGEIEFLPGSQIIPVSQINMPSVLPLPIKKIKSGENIFGLKERRFLCVSIDMTQDKETIIKELSELYAKYSQQAKMGRRRRDTTIVYMKKFLSHWDVYDKFESNQSYHQIAEELLGRGIVPSKDREGKSYIDRIRLAHKKALRQIEEVEELSLRT